LLAYFEFVFSHIHVRYQSAANYRINEGSTLSMTKYLDSIGGCASWCTAIGDKCEAFSSKYISTDSSFDEVGYLCEFAFSNYSGYMYPTSGWLLWTKKTTTQASRSVTTMAPTSPEPECPVVWRKWAPDDPALGLWTADLSTIKDSYVASNAIDKDNTTLAMTKKHGNNRYPYLLLDLGRSMRVTKVSVLGGIDSFKNPLMNLDVRVGNYSAVGHDAYSIITYNTRCGVYYGPTVIDNQWIDVDCGYEYGIYGRYISLQLLDRHLIIGNSALEVGEVEVSGWARTCSRDV